MGTEMTGYVPPATAGEAEWIASQRRWLGGWRRGALAAVPLAYLVFVVISVTENSHGSGRVAGYAILGAFAACWLAAPVLFSRETSWRAYWAYFGLLLGLSVAGLPFAHAAGFVAFLFLTMLSVGRLGRWSIPLVAAFSLAALIVPVLIPSWHVSIGASFDDVTPVAIPIVAIVMFAVLQVLRGNQALAEARAELAQLAAENERIRIARDLHDLLGHSLTTITVKAGLARRLGAADPARAVSQIAEVEELCRQALADVRSAVSGYHDVTLAGELARGRELLRASGIAADLPTATDVVDPAHSELFGWTVREGLTNVVRHARARSCAIRLSRSAIEIVDDGVGEVAPAGGAISGNGLSGLRERVSAAGGQVDAGPLQAGGWQLRVTLAPEGGR
ncbi:MAG TPA: sensor histidine kinase [Streptosporangiaceae bacterium]|nr:sensor histidine kinase [Streptosporangiaceae bacterium]